MIRRRRLFESDRILNKVGSIKTALDKRKDRASKKVDSWVKKYDAEEERKLRLMNVKLGKLKGILDNCYETLQEYYDLTKDPNDQIYEGEDGMWAGADGSSITLEKNGEDDFSAAVADAWMGYFLIWYHGVNEVSGDPVRIVKGDDGTYTLSDRDFDDGPDACSVAVLNKMVEEGIEDPVSNFNAILGKAIQKAEQMRDGIEKELESRLDAYERREVRGMKESRSLRGRSLRESRLRRFRRR